MILDEKGLARNLKHAYKHGGYTITANNEQIIIYTEAWAVRVDWDKLPRKCLATIVEHIGLLPRSGDAIFIQDGVDPQVVMPETVGGDVAIWYRDTQTTEKATIVPAMINRGRLFQDSALRVYSIRADYLTIVKQDAIKGTMVTILDNSRANWSAEGEDIMLTTRRPADLYYQRKSQKTVWEALETVDLHMEDVSDE